MGKQRVGPQPGIPITVGDELGLEFSAAVMGPWVLDWERLLGIVGQVDYCFVEKRVWHEFRADVLVLGVVSAVVDVHVWKTLGGGVVRKEAA